LGQFGRKRKVVDGAVLTEKSKELRSVLKALFDWSEAQEIALRAK
jgi:DNA-binding HxlR family transcriptional regulator